MLAPDTILQNRYRIVRKLGEGGMGAVYEAVDLRLKATVAVKETLGDVEHSRRAFEHEASLLANLRHASLPKVTDHFAEGTGQFLVMEFVAGEDLAQLLRQRGRAFAPSMVLEWAEQLLSALHYLHSHTPPILHRDIKPSNIKLGAQGQAILLDFGLAKGSVGQMSTMTSNKSIVGFTPLYAPLEQIAGAGTDVRSDIYSLGATLYHLITGVMPTDAPTRFEALEEAGPDPLRSINELNPEVPLEIAEVLGRAMAVRRRDRFRNVLEMRAALERAGQALPPGDGEYETKSVQPAQISTPAPVIETGNSGAWPPAPANAAWEQSQSSLAAMTSPATLGVPTKEQAVNSSGQPFNYAHATAAFQRARKPRRAVWIAAGVAVLLIASVIVFLVSYRGGQGASASASPTETIQAYFDAMRREDVEAYKRTLSKEALREIDAMAEKRGASSVDKYLQNVLSDISFRLPRETVTRNEKIDGERASVEMRASDGTWVKWDLIKEDGAWKIAHLGPS
ncbi:MAG TPA: protein kinase [Pyrinomonadaceae bacterium]